jgi:DNA-binding response OmpR family regulator
LEKKKVLIVDDERDILETLKVILERKGYITDTAETGKEAIEKSKQQFYNLALLDIMLPDMEGTELLTKLHDTMPRMMKIMVTGSPSLQYAVKALNLGADAYVLKPINPKELLKIVEEKLREQSEVEMLSEEKVAEWMNTRLRVLKQEKS